MGGLVADDQLGTPVVAAQDIHMHFGGVHALSGASLQLYPGEVHCLAGENGCGKSTLIKVISGIHRPTSGVLAFDGKVVSQLTPRTSIDLGVSVIYQDFALLPNMTVAENIALPSMATMRVRLFRSNKAESLAEQALARLGVSISPRAVVESLGIADRQLVAIARSLAQQARVVILDEPTTALTWREVDVLFAALDGLRQQGVSLVFVSHKLQEMMRISDRITVMRNGAVAATGLAAEFDRSRIVEATTGRDLLPSPSPTNGCAHRPAQPGRLEVLGLARKGMFENITLHVGAGEIVGLTGLLGSGRTEIAEALFGLQPADSGSIIVDHEPVALRSPAAAIAAGIAYVPEDRLSQGLFLDQSIEKNISSANLVKYQGPLGALQRAVLRKDVGESVTDLRIKVDSIDAPVRVLSGGNAQRVVLSRWLMRNPKVLILNGPTVGVDVGSKFDILAILRSRALEGAAILLISDDLTELVSCCSRVYIVRQGRMAGHVAGLDLTEQQLELETKA
jgi:simple sugar transport system ATP-binding protein